MIEGKKYAVIYADPPWKFSVYSAKGEGRSATAHYNCLSLDQLYRLPVSEIAADDSVLFLWTTDPFLPKGIDLASAWGFNYKTVAFYWAKLNKSADKKLFSEKDFFTGLGYWTRANLEPCLLATRGSPKRISKKVKRLIISPRREHSRKPDEVFARIEELVEGPYVELFARASRHGWDSWGDQASLFDQGPVVTRMFPSDLRKYSRPEVGEGNELA
jgi:N6-adenosine-specific RNA methylase IME4